MAQPVNEEHRVYPIQVGEVHLKFETSPVPAAEILGRAGAKPPESFSLEALDKPKGTVVAQFGGEEPVDLNEKDRKFFRAVPRGGGQS
jgi:hypothetical protein